MKNLEKAIKIAVDAHTGQTDKGGNPYILHPLRVMFNLNNESEKIVGVLHDVLEDTNVKIEDIKKEGFSVEVVDALILITKNVSQNYEDYIEGIKSNVIALKVKIADIEDNLDVKRLNIISEDDSIRINKYLKMHRYLKK